MAGAAWLAPVILVGCLELPALESDDAVERFHELHPGAEFEAGCEEGALAVRWAVPQHPLVDHYRVLLHHGGEPFHELEVGHVGEGEAAFPAEVVDACSPGCTFELVAVDGEGRLSEPLLHAEVWVDLDGDGYASIACGGTDCDDEDPSVHPGAVEQCDGRDTSCSGVVDDIDPLDIPLAEKQDGVCEDALKVCEGEDGWVEPDYALHSELYDEVERCDGFDNTCSGFVDDVDPATAPEAEKQDGVCAGATQVCVEGEWVEPDYFAYSELYDTEDRCEGDDNDCDGRVDKIWAPDPDRSSLWCMGTYERNRPDRVADGPFRTLATNKLDSTWWGWVDPFACAIDLDDRLYCWGSLYWAGALGLGHYDYVGREILEVVGDAAWLTVDAAYSQACGLQLDGSLWCWGARYEPDEHSGESAVNPTRTTHTPERLGDEVYASISLGSLHGCALQDDGSLWCWGRNHRGQLGFDDLLDRALPTRVGTGTWAQVATGADHTCVLDEAGGLECWGRNVAGQVGAAPSPHETDPQNIVHPEGLVWTAVAGGGEHTCALDEDGAAWCWGDNTYGALGDGPDGPAPRLAAPGPFVSLSLAQEHSCALTADGERWCWGFGPLGDGRLTETRYEPAPLDPGGWLVAESGANIGCGIAAEDGALWCWGVEWEATGPGYEQLRLRAEEGVRSVSSGSTHTCHVTAADGALWCDGSNFAGQLGTGDQRGSIEPLQIIDGGIRSVHVGGSFTCALDLEGGRLCWGVNTSGELGDDTTTTRWEVGEVLDGPWTHLAAGVQHNCAIDEDDLLWCWGLNFTGQLGLDDTTRRLVPTSVGSDRWASVSAGHSFTCGIDEGGDLYCWGSNSQGQLGDDTTTQRLVPTPVHEDGPWRVVAAGTLHTCAIDTSDELWCWGYNLHGQLGLGDQTGRLVPTKLPGTWATVSASTFHTCGQQTDGSVWCWGTNWDYQLGFVPDLAEPDAWRVLQPMLIEGEWSSVRAAGRRTCLSEVVFDYVDCATD